MYELTLPGILAILGFAVFQPDNQNVTGPTVLENDLSAPFQNGTVNVDNVDGGSNVCLSPACRLAAQSIFGAINFTADPCDDFFSYACGSWVASRPIPDSEKEVSFFRDLYDQMKLTVQGMLEEKKDNMFDSEVKARTFYAQCKLEGEIEYLGAQPLIDMLNDIIGGWPILNPNWDASKFDLQTVVAKAREHGDEPLFAITVDQDRTSPTENVIILSAPDGVYTKDVLSSETGVVYDKSTATYMHNVVALMFNETEDSRNVSEVMADLSDQYELSRLITMAGQTKVEMQDTGFLKNKTSLGANQNATFTRSLLFQNMSNVIRGIFDSVGLGDQITPGTEIVLRYPPFFDWMDEKLRELENLGNDGKRRLANYIGWRLVDKNVQTISKPYRDELDGHIQRLQGKKARKPRPAAERCSSAVKDAFPLVVSAVYVRDRLPVDLKAKASLMVDDVKAGFLELLTEATWMDNDTFAYAVRKLDAMLDTVAYSDVLVNNISLIDAEYKDMYVGPSFFVTLQGLNKEKAFRNLKLLIKENERDDPIGHPVDVTKINAENTVEKNLVLVTAAILQRPFFEADLPQYLNYGGIGFVIGHETTHSFDDQGALYDEVGNMRSWWTNSTTRAYNERKQTFVEQYNGLRLASVNGSINGLLTLSENIADNGGLKASYRAYFNHFVKRLSSPEPSFPGYSNTTAEQLFFLSAGQIWCINRRPEFARVNLLEDEHSPPQFRVNIPMSNMPEFAQAFNCPVGSRMNPSVKHAVW